MYIYNSYALINKIPTELIKIINEFSFCPGYETRMWRVCEFINHQVDCSQKRIMDLSCNIIKLHAVNIPDSSRNNHQIEHSCELMKWQKRVYTRYIHMIDLDYKNISRLFQTYKLVALFWFKHPISLKCFVELRKTKSLEL